MDEDGEHGGDQFYRNEAISAVADDGFMAEEDEDYEDLYNDVNVGEGFRQSLQKTELSEVKIEAVEEKKLPPPPPLPLPPPPPPLTAHGVGGVSAFQNQELIGNEVGVQGGGIRVELGQKAATLSGIGEQGGNTGVELQGIIGQQQQPPLGVGGFVGGVGNDGLMRQGQGGGVGGGSGGAGGGGGSTVLFVGDLHWWTTDADLEAELCKYGQVKDVRFFDEKASGKSKGYCQVEFYDPLATTACKEGMNGHLFNGRPCVVSYANPYTVKKMGEALNNRNQPMNPTAGANQGRRGPAEVGGVKPGGGNVGTGGNYQGGDGNNNNNNNSNNNNNRGSGRGNWGRGNNPGMGNRGHGNPMRNRGGGMGGRGMIGNAGNGYGPGIGAGPPMMHPGFDPSFGGPIGRVGGYAGYPGGPTPPFSGMMPSYPGMHGVAPHVNPGFFGRGMHMNAIGMIPPSGMDGPNMGMWPDPNMGGWGGDELGGGKVAESSYGEEAASDHQYGEVNPDRAGWQNTMREKDRGSERDWSGSSERRYRDDRDQGYERDVPREKDAGHDPEWPERKHRDDREVVRERSRDRDRGREKSRDRERERGDRDRERDRYREDRDRYADHHRYRDREPEHDEEWERGRSSRTHSKSRLSQDEEHHSRSKDADYGKRRRLTSE
ncbi:putative nucleotide-binding alpha-beta plait domain-containing protein [Medicago truncatula]|uniref:Putative nucleotide-binding alpha-beta plait domain-containing protein n=1 Tax=Medicago truncatula TaxID=3880 RepID=A0A396ISE3_MEDTR|nr:uncharacterized PE-PGRS family protein PE_PGRS54 [Medicago truncatula]RHN67403.1 putative nucleotide-binding alpha-beta plait domain-containing protein [Medicago truncatula]